MTPKKILPLVAAIFAATLLPYLAKADSVSLTLANPVQTITASGATLAFSGTVTNTNSVTEYFSGDSLALGLSTGEYSYDDASFQNNLLTLAPNESYTGDLFTLTLISGLTPGSYVGTYSVSGGPAMDFSDQDQLGAATLQVNVNAPAAAATPEPSSLVLLATGGLSVAGMLRRRFIS